VDTRRGRALGRNPLGMDGMRGKRRKGPKNQKEELPKGNLNVCYLVEKASAAGQKLGQRRGEAEGDREHMEPIQTKDPKGER